MCHKETWFTQVCVYVVYKLCLCGLQTHIHTHTKTHIRSHKHGSVKEHIRTDNESEKHAAYMCHKETWLKQVCVYVVYKVCVYVVYKHTHTYTHLVSKRTHKNWQGKWEAYCLHVPQGNLIYTVLRLCGLQSRVYLVYKLGVYVVYKLSMWFTKSVYVVYKLVSVVYKVCVYVVYKHSHTKTHMRPHTHETVKEHVRADKESEKHAAYICYKAKRDLLRSVLMWFTNFVFM